MFQFLVTALGECYRDGECVMGSIPVPESPIVRDLLGPASHDPDSMEDHRRVIREVEGVFIDALFVKMAMEKLLPQERTVYGFMYPLVTYEGDGRFRYRGGLRDNGEPFALLITEFLAHPDDRAVWSAVERLRGDTHGKVEILRENEDERQVEVTWPIWPLTRDQITAKRNGLTVKTQELWDQAGVCVL